MRYLLIIPLFILFSCKQNKVGEKHERKESIIQNSNDFLDCIKNITVYDEVRLNEIIKEYTKENDTGYFVKKENQDSYNKCSVSSFNNTKGNHSTDNFFYNIERKNYYPIFKKIKEKFIIVGSLVQFYGENDIPGVFFQLNLFNYDGEQIDYLIIYNRFNFELSFKYDFKLNDKFSEIIIEKTEEDWLLFDEDGEMIGERENPKVKKDLETFKINSKGFSLINN